MSPRRRVPTKCFSSFLICAILLTGLPSPAGAGEQPVRANPIQDVARTPVQAQAGLTPTPAQSPIAPISPEGPVVFPGGPPPEPVLDLPREARSIEELVQGRLPIIAATARDGTDVAQIPSAGAAVTFLSGRVAVVAGEGSFEGDVDLKVRPLAETEETASARSPGGDSPPVHQESLIRFEIEAASSDDGAPVVSFPRPVHLVLDLVPLHTTNLDFFQLLGTIGPL